MGDDDDDDDLDDQPPSKRPHIDMDQHNSDLKLLKAEMKKSKPKSKVLKNLMDETELERRRWITSDCPTAHEVVAEYPSLRVQRWVSYAIFSMSKCTMCLHARAYYVGTKRIHKSRGHG